jgi:hypothetical protein
VFSWLRIAAGSSRRTMTLAPAAGDVERQGV